ncbi:phage major capsid protein [Bacillus thuringiensis]|nr:phage major capsid protein [Bacillus thuringiensis]
MDTIINSNILTVDIKKDILEGRQYNHYGFPLLFNVIPTEGKTTRVISSDDRAGSRAVFVAENESIPFKDTWLRETVLTPKRIGTTIEVSEEFMDDPNVDIEGYFKQIFIDRIIDGVEFQMISTGTENGTEPKNIQKFITDTQNTASTVEDEALSFEDMMASYKIFITNPSNKRNAFWVISKFAKLSVLDNKGNEKLSFENIPDGADATLLGLPVYQKNLGSANSATEPNGELRPVAYAITNREAYTIAMKDITIKQIKGDTKQALRNSFVFMAESWIDGKVTNKYAKISAIFAPEVQQASVTEQSIDEPKPVKRKATKIEKA